MGRKKIHRTEEELKEYHAKRQREYYARNSDKINKRKMELYYEKKNASKI